MTENGLDEKKATSGVYSYITGIIKALGLVFGDIGTSPIYTLTVVFMLTKPTETNVIGVLSLVVWTLTILVSIEYAWLATSLGHRGEGAEKLFL
jgi:KUP system potassium uptake protein